MESTFDHTLPDPIADNVAKLKAVRAALGERICLGVGTALTVEEVRAAHEAGAEYVLSPNTDLDVIRETKKLGMFSIPGAMTPSEIVRHGRQVRTLSSCSLQMIWASTISRI